MLRRILAFCLIVNLSLQLAPAQQPETEPPLPVIRATTRAVLVDMVVTDKQGKPITDLKPEEVVLKESGKAQKISSFRLERLGGQPKSMPAGLFTNRPEYKAPPGPVSIVLLDALNTNVQNQQQARQALLSYLASQFQPGMRMAVYGLTNNLIRLQEFTTDPSRLLAAIQNYKPGVAANIPTGTGGTTTTINVPVGRTGESVQVTRFLSDTTPQVLDARIATTLAAMREIARMTGGMNGRKNLIWISAGFPITFSPDEGTTITSGMIERVNCPTCPPPLANEAHVQANSNVVDRFKDEIHRTSAAMTSSQIALYPVDARGLMGHEAAQATTGGLSGENVAGVANTQDSMRELAIQTGGKAYYNRNDIDTAVALATDDGGSYYALSYSSTNKKFNGDYRSIKIEVNRPNVQVRHRAGYYAYDNQRASSSKNKGKDPSAGLTLADVASDSTLVLFDAQLAAKPAQNGKSTFPVLFRVDPKSVSWGDAGKHDVDIDLYVLAVDSAGKVAANSGMTVTQSLDDNQYSQVTQGGLVVPVEISLAGGEYTMKLAVRDNRTAMLGSMTVPVKID